MPAFRGSDAELATALRGCWDAARAGDLGAERELVALRNQLGIRSLSSARGTPSFPAIDGIGPGDRTESAASGGLPVFTIATLTPQRLRAGILRDGCVLVRGLIDRGEAVRLADSIEAAFAQRALRDSGRPHDPHLYDEFVPDARVGDELERGWIQQGGGLLAVDSPALQFALARMIRSVGLEELVRGYLGEPMLVAAQKTTLRRAEPEVAGAWHQDGRFMGSVRSLNLWLALSRCGDESPGLDIVPKRIEHFVETGTDDAIFDHMISEPMAQRVAGIAGVSRPLFEPGDALLFDDLFLHKTGSDPGMRRPRYAIENWFFGASGFPGEYVPLAV
jgi:hypothetical protein